MMNTVYKIETKCNNTNLEICYIIRRNLLTIKIFLMDHKVRKVLIN